MKKRWCIPKVSAGSRVAHWEDVLELYDPKRPAVCFEEKPYQMVAEKRLPMSARPGCPEHYERRGVCNLLMFVEKASWRHIDRERRTAVDFAQQMRKLADEHYISRLKG